MALLNIIRGDEATLLERPVSDGALLFATDTKKIYLDKGTQRIEMSSAQDLSNYITEAELTKALQEESSARQKQDQLLQESIAARLDASDIIAGSNVSVSQDAESGHVTISATNTNTTYTLSKSGSTITLTGSDGKSTSVTDANTTYTLASFGVTATAAELNYMDGVTSNVQTQLNGKAASSHTHAAASTSAAGFAPKLSGSTTQYLRGDGSWATPPDTNTTYSAFKGATTSAAGSAGLVPAPATGAANRYLRSDGTWTTPPDTNTTYSAMKGASSSAAGSTGLVPAPAAGASNRYLRSDGTWQVPPDTNTTYTLSSFGITATATEINKLDGLATTKTELGYLDGVTSNVQTQLNGKAASNHTHSNYLTTSGTAAAATKLATARKIGLSGDASGSVSFNGTANVNIPATVLHHGATSIPKNANFNSYTDPGWYYCPDNATAATLTNRPTGKAFAMLVLQHAGILQMVFEYMTRGYKIYVRNNYDGSWGSWARVYTTVDKPTYSDVGAAAASHSHSNYLTTSGTAAAATKLATARTIALSGDVTGSASFNGSANATISAQIAANAVTANEIAAGAVGSSEIADNAVTAAKIASGSVGTSELASNAVTLAKLGSDVGTVAVQSSQPSDSNIKIWVQI